MKKRGQEAKSPTRDHAAEEMLPAAYRRSNSNPSPRGAMMRRVPPRESVTTKIDRRLRQVDHCA